MSDRFLWAGSAILLLTGLLGGGAAQASVRCQCNNGTVTQAMGVDSDDDDVDAACNEACDMLGGGRVWNVTTTTAETRTAATTDGGPRRFLSADPVGIAPQAAHARARSRPRENFANSRCQAE